MRSHANPLLTALVVAGLILTAATADATQPHDRNGFFIGFGLGGGSASLTNSDGESDSDGGGTGQFRIGGAVTPQLTLGLESASWTHTYSEAGVDFTWTFSVGTFGATWFPIVDQGFFVRGGLGFGRAQADLAVGSVRVSASEGGLGLLAATGYEWRLTRKFALGPQVELTHIAIGGDEIDSITVVDGALQFNWYW